MAQDTEAAELMTGLPKTVIEKIATLDMDEIDDLAETVGVSLYTLRLNRLLKFDPTSTEIEG